MDDRQTPARGAARRATRTRAGDDQLAKRTTGIERRCGKQVKATRQGKASLARCGNFRLYVTCVLTRYEIKALASLARRWRASCAVSAFSFALASRCAASFAFFSSSATLAWACSTASRAIPECDAAAGRFRVPGPALGAALVAALAHALASVRSTKLIGSRDGGRRRGLLPAAVRRRDLLPTLGRPGAGGIGIAAA